MLVAMGGAPNASIEMGKKNDEGAEHIMGSCVALQLVISAVLTAALLIWNRPLLLMFGASENTIGYASQYMQTVKISRRESGALLNSLIAGVVPRVGLRHIAVGRQKEVGAFLQDLSTIEDGGASFRLVTGQYGSGKSFLLQMIRNNAMHLMIPSFIRYLLSQTAHFKILASSSPAASNQLPSNSSIIPASQAAEIFGSIGSFASTFRPCFSAISST